jgi:anti-sigma factor RsiW
MNCRSAESLYSAFIEDEISQKERRSLESHLLGCRRCSTAVRELRATIALTRSLPATDVSVHFEEDVLLRIRSGEALRPTMLEWLASLAPPVRLRPVLAASAGLCAVSLAAFVVFHPFTTGAPAPNPAAPSGVASNLSPTPAGEPASQTEAAAPVERFTPAAGAAVASSSGPAVDAQRPVRRSPPELIQSPLALEGSLSAGDSARTLGRPLAPQYQDEYILDQFYLEGVPTSRDPSVVPASGSPNDDVYITF